MTPDEMDARNGTRWTCGHKAGPACGQCYRELAAKANALAEENEMLREAILMTGGLLLEAGRSPSTGSGGAD